MPGSLPASFGSYSKIGESGNVLAYSAGSKQIGAVATNLPYSAIKAAADSGQITDVTTVDATMLCGQIQGYRSCFRELNGGYLQVSAISGFTGSEELAQVTKQLYDAL